MKKVETSSDGSYQSIQDAFFVKNGQLVGGDGTLNQLEFLHIGSVALPVKRFAILLSFWFHFVLAFFCTNARYDVDGEAV